MYLILGAGITGVCTAFYLSQLDPESEIVVVDSEGCVAGCASGKAGGFLARDWPRSQLSRKSFDLHAELASTLEGPTKWLYRRVDTYSANLVDDTQADDKSSNNTLDWIHAATKPSKIGSTTNTAQVHPRLFCEALFARSKASLLHATVCDLVASDGIATGVTVRDNDGQMRTINASHVVVALGPWCDYLVREKWGIPIREVGGQIGHSIVFQSDSQHPIPAHCLFTEMNKMEGPEVYPRSDGSIYMCGGGSSLGDESSSDDLLPASPALVKPSERAISKLMQLSDSLFGSNRMKDTVVKQACFLPVSEKGALIGRIAGFSNLYIGTGNAVWGILNGPATGLALAELILYGESRCVGLSRYNPMEK
ncbi:hypothetical protein HDU78_006755 [Chytriomyces hyalinus]|nr:hypothetical protein HDU78_006755 [Chytriomyces hyalinus]